MELGERLRRASGTPEELASVLYDSSEEVLLALLDNPRLNDEHLQVLLSRKNLALNVLREIGARDRLLRAYPVKLAYVRHPRAARHAAMVLLRHLYPFDLLAVAATPGTASELKRAAEEALLTRLPAMPAGERLTMARRGTSRMAAALLADPEPRIFGTALDNPRLTEEGIGVALRNRSLSPAVVAAIARHPRWSLRYDLRPALIRHPATSLATVLTLVGQVRLADVAAVLDDRGMPAERREYLRRLIAAERGRQVSRARRARAGAT